MSLLRLEGGSDAAAQHADRPDREGAPRGGGGAAGVRRGARAGARPRRLRRRVHRARRQSAHAREPPDLQRRDRRRHDARAAPADRHQDDRGTAAKVPLGRLPAQRDARRLQIPRHRDAVQRRQRGQHPRRPEQNRRRRAAETAARALQARLHARLRLLAGVRGALRHRPADAQTAADPLRHRAVRGALRVARLRRAQARLRLPRRGARRPADLARRVRVRPQRVRRRRQARAARPAPADPARRLRLARAQRPGRPEPAAQGRRARGAHAVGRRGERARRPLPALQPRQGADPAARGRGGQGAERLGELLRARALRAVEQRLRRSTTPTSRRATRRRSRSRGSSR